MKATIPTVATYAVVLCSLALTANTLHTEYRRRHPPPTAPWKTIGDSRALASTGNRIGTQNPRTTVVVFSDYECPACLYLDTQLRAIEREYPSVGIVYHNFPLPFHEHARAAALAAQCAASQGRFAEYHSRLFDDHGMLGKERWTSVAAALHVSDTVAFNDCLRGPAAASAIDADINAGTKLGIYATPTIIVGKEMYLGTPLDLKDIIERHLAANQADTKGGAAVATGT